MERSADPAVSGELVEVIERDNHAGVPVEPFAVERVYRIAGELHVEWGLTHKLIELTAAARAHSPPVGAFTSVLRAEPAGCRIQIARLATVHKHISFEHQFAVIVKSAEVENLPVAG